MRRKLGTSCLNYYSTEYVEAIFNPLGLSVCENLERQFKRTGGLISPDTTL